MTPKKTILCASIIGLSFAAHAFTRNEFQGQYLSLNGGGVYVHNIYQNNASKNGFLGGGLNLFLGDQINDYFGPEIGFAFFALGPYGRVGIATLNGKFTLPLGVMNDFVIFAKAGIGYAELMTTIPTSSPSLISDNFVESLGLGAGYNFAERWRTTLEYNGAWFSSAPNATGLIGGVTLGVTHYFTLF